MKILDTTATFFELAEVNQTIELATLDQYYNTYPDVFNEYFPNHCPRTEERLNSAIERYAAKMEDMRLVVSQLPTIIDGIMQVFTKHFGFELDLQFNLLVGAFGSNAFVERKIIGQVYFAVEKLSPNPDHLRIIVAHEIGHIYHNALSDRAGMDWSKVDWTHGMISLYREGVATYISQQIVKGIDESAYYSYDDSGAEWLEFYKGHLDKIACSFLADSTDWTFDKEREWFRLSGGSYYGYNRLGYYLGTSFVRELVEEVGEINVLTFWVDEDMKSKIGSWLEQKTTHLKDVTTIYIVRHGETEWNVQKRKQGHQDSPLTELGKQQAQWLGEALKNEKIDYIYSSSSNRAYHTAEYIRGNRNINIVKCNDLREINLGEWEGLTHEEAKANNAEQHENFWNRPDQFKVNNSETFMDVEKRALSVLNAILTEYKGKSILVVTHTVVVKLLMAYFEGRAMNDIWNPPYIHPACLCKIEINNNEIQILLHGDTTHYQVEENVNYFA